MKKTGWIILLGAVCIVVITGLALAGSSANFAIPWDVLGHGGNEMASMNYSLKSTIGQTATGPMSSPNFDIGAGYWYRLPLSEQSRTIFLPLTNKN